MIKPCLGVALIAYIGLFYTSAAAVTEYDQRQQGDVNVQLDLKDVQIVAVIDSDLLEDYVNYDYAYDYSDFTIKPINKPTTSTTSPSSTTESFTTSTNGPSIETNPSSNENKTDGPINQTMPPATVNFNNSETTSTASATITDKQSSVTDSYKESSTTETKRNLRICSSKLISSLNERCRRRRISILPISTRMAPKLKNPIITLRL